MKGLARRRPSPLGWQWNLLHYPRYGAMRTPPPLRDPPASDWPDRHRTSSNRLDEVPGLIARRQDSTTASPGSPLVPRAIQQSLLGWIDNGYMILPSSSTSHVAWRQTVARGMLDRVPRAAQHNPAQDRWSRPCRWTTDRCAAAFSERDVFQHFVAPTRMPSRQLSHEHRAGRLSDRDLGRARGRLTRERLHTTPAYMLPYLMSEDLEVSQRAALRAKGKDEEYKGGSRRVLGRPGSSRSSSGRGMRRHSSGTRTWSTGAYAIAGTGHLPYIGASSPTTSPGTCSAITRSRSGRPCAG